MKITKLIDQRPEFKNMQNVTEKVVMGKPITTDELACILIYCYAHTASAKTFPEALKNSIDRAAIRFFDAAYKCCPLNAAMLEELVNEAKLTASIILDAVAREEV